MKVYATDIRRLSLKSNRSMMDCKKALTMFDGDAEKAYQWLLENTKERENVVEEKEEMITNDEPVIEEKYTEKERIQKGYKFLNEQRHNDFEKILEPIAQSNKEAALLLMNYHYTNKFYMGEYFKYKEAAMELKHPLAFYHEGVLSLKQIHHHENAFVNFVKAYQYGYSEVKEYIYKLYDVLKLKYNEQKSYQYHSMDIDPFMFACIYHETTQKNYIKFLKDQDVKEERINQWCYQNFQNRERNMVIDFQFKDDLQSIFKNRNRIISFTKHGTVDYEDGIKTVVCLCDKDIIHYLNQIMNPIIVSSLPHIEFKAEVLMNMKIYNRLDMKAYLMNRYHTNSLNEVFKNEQAERIIGALKQYEPYQNRKLMNQQSESLAFLQSKIIDYEECMRLHKQTCNRFLALHYLWSMSETTNFHFYDYLQMAKEEILSLDKQFVMVRNAYLDQLKLSEYKNKMWCQGEQYSKQRRISYLRNKLRWNQNICVDIYEDRLNNLIQKYHFNISSEEVIAYFTIQEENIVVLSKERLYSNLLKKDIPLEDLICLRMDEQRKVYALYRTGERQIAIQGNGVGLTTLIECINEWTLYL